MSVSRKTPESAAPNSVKSSELMSTLVSPFVSTKIESDRSIPYTVEIISGSLSELTYSLRKPFPRYNRILVPLVGNAICQVRSGQSFLISPGTTAVIDADSPSTLVFGRGLHSWVRIGHPTQRPEPTTPSTKVFHKLINEKTLPCTIFKQLTERVVEKCLAGEIETAYIAAWLNLIEEHPTTKFERPFLTQTVPPKNEAIGQLIEAIKARPTENWSLGFAAEMVGYSSFHLSRIFQSEIQMGFPEFVERARTEIAIQLLLTTQISIGQVATQSGFGSSPTMRNACQQLTGFLPSELRGSAGE